MQLAVHHNHHPTPNCNQPYTVGRISSIIHTWKQRPQYTAVIIDDVAYTSLPDLLAFMLVAGLLIDIHNSCY